MTYEETIEYEKNIKLVKKAEEIYNQFLKNVKLDVDNYKGDNRFLFWSDNHNATYFKIKDNNFYFECRFLHETYNVLITPEGIFNGLKKNYRGIDHLISAVRNK